MFSTMGKKKPPTDASSDRHKYPLLSLRPSDALRAVLVEYARRERRSVSQAIILLLEGALETKGLWPPSDEETA